MGFEFDVLTDVVERERLPAGQIHCATSLRHGQQQPVLSAGRLPLRAKVDGFQRERPARLAQQVDQLDEAIAVMQGADRISQPVAHITGPVIVQVAELPPADHGVGHDLGKLTGCVPLRCVHDGHVATIQDGGFVCDSPSLSRSLVRTASVAATSWPKPAMSCCAVGGGRRSSLWPYSPS